MKKIIIGIDPDVDKSGVAFKQGKEIRLSNMTFFQIYDALKGVREANEKENILVYIECGYLNKGNWHVTIGSNVINAQIGQRTGANHQISKLLIQMCEFLDINFIAVKPTKSKVNAEFFKQITKIETRTNQEQRDALMLIWGLA
jgi:hypothetical protein